MCVIVCIGPQLLAFVGQLSLSFTCRLMQADSETSRGPGAAFRDSAEMGVLVHASLNTPVLCFNIVWIPPDVRTTFPELLS